MHPGTVQPAPCYVGHSQFPGPIQGPHKRARELLLFGEVHYGPDLSVIQGGSCANKIRLLCQSAAQKWVFCL